MVWPLFTCAIHNRIQIYRVPGKNNNTDYGMIIVHRIQICRRSPKYKQAWWNFESKMRGDAISNTQYGRDYR